MLNSSHSKFAEISTVSSEDAHPDRSVKTTNESISHQGIEINNVQPDISTSITESHNQTNGHKELDSESLSSYGSGVGNVPSSPRSSVADNQDKIDVASRSSYQEYTDSGIDECNAAGVDTNASKSVLPEKAITGTVAPSSLDVGKTSDTTTEVRIARCYRTFDLFQCVQCAWECAFCLMNAVWQCVLIADVNITLLY